MYVFRRKKIWSVSRYKGPRFRDWIWTQTYSAPVMWKSSGLLPERANNAADRDADTNDGSNSCDDDHRDAAEIPADILRSRLLPAAPTMTLTNGPVGHPAPTGAAGGAAVPMKVATTIVKISIEEKRALAKYFASKNYLLTMDLLRMDEFGNNLKAVVT